MSHIIICITPFNAQFIYYFDKHVARFVIKYIKMFICDKMKTRECNMYLYVFYLI